MMPGADGFDVGREIRAASDVPILFLTAREGDSDKLRGFRLGADDYIVTWPVHAAASWPPTRSWPPCRYYAYAGPVPLLRPSLEQRSSPHASPSTPPTRDD
jgi:hypothetical protein